MARRSIVVYGNCQSQDVARILPAVLARPDLYDVHHHFVVMDEAARSVWERQVREADLIFAQDVANWSSYPFRDLAEVRPVIRFPFVYFAALWPFDAHQNRADEVASAQQPDLPVHLTFAFQDSLLGRLRAEVPDPDRRFEAYRELRATRVINIARFAASEESRLAIMDRTYRFGLGAYILDNFRSRRLFHAITHPTIDLAVEQTRHICSVAGIATAAQNQAFPDPQAWYQVPLHPRVIADLGITWADDRTQYRFRDTMLTFEQYVRGYIALYG